ncbi:MAG: DUF2062 domain-containing protein [Deltaproteobacteria bacterium]|nr:DUF2062 domain-containing protein [Deltaproteobacteria bacterium]
MNDNKTLVDPDKAPSNGWRHKFRKFIHEAKTLQGDPTYIAKGIAIGVFVGITPTIPLHTGIAIFLAFIFKASKPAAVIGVWSGNPVTIPFLYFGSYKIGMFLFGNTATLDISYLTIQEELLQLGFETTIAMILGGMILGILPAIAAYFITRNFFSAIRERKAR